MNMNPILQFGTSRFLQAHADLFISEALQQQDGEALGGIMFIDEGSAFDDRLDNAGGRRQP